MDINRINYQFEVRKITNDDLENILEYVALDHEVNKLTPTKESILDTMSKAEGDKDRYYLCLYEFCQAVCLLDFSLVNNDIKLNFIYMVRIFKRYGLGTSIIKQLAQYMQGLGYENIIADNHKDNEIGKAFLTSIGFKLLDDTNNEFDTYIWNIKGFKIYSVLDKFK